MAFNWEAAFIAYSQGSSLPDISMRLAIPIETMEDRARQMRWKRLAPSVAAAVKTIESIDVSFDMIKENREKSLKEAEPLELLLNRTLEIFNRWWIELAVAEDDFIRKGEELVAAQTDHEQNETNASQMALETAKTRLMNARGERDQCRKAAAPSPKSLAELAKAITEIQGIRYRALGDLPNAMTGERSTAPQTAAKIYINMPGAIRPPGKMAPDVQIIDVQADKV